MTIVIWIALNVKTENILFSSLFIIWYQTSRWIRSLYRRLKKTNENGKEINKENNMTNEVKSNNTHLRMAQFSIAYKELKVFFFFLFLFPFSMLDSTKRRVRFHTINDMKWEKGKTWTYVQRTMFIRAQCSFPMSRCVSCLLISCTKLDACTTICQILLALRTQSI